MRRPLALLALALAVPGLALAWAGARGAWVAPAADASGTLVPGLAALACACLAGRVLLSLLPAGPLGAHRPDALPATLGASLLLGVVALSAQARILALLPWGAAPGAAPSGLLAALLVGPWLLAGAARVATLPGAMVPRHPPREEPPSRAARLLLAAVVLAGLAPLALVLLARVAPEPTATAGGLGGVSLLLAALGLRSEGAGGALAAGAWGALLALLGHGLATARRGPGERRLALAFLAASPLGLVLAREPLAALALALCGAAAAAALGWVRRADRRELWVAALALGGLGLAGEPRTASAGLLALVLVTPAPARRSALVAGLAGALLGLAGAPLPAAAVAGGALGPAAGTDLLPWPPLAPWGALWIVFAVAVAAGIRRERGGGGAPEDAAAARFLVLFVVLGFLLAADLSPALRALLAPVAFLYAGLELGQRSSSGARTVKSSASSCSPAGTSTPRP